MPQKKKESKTGNKIVWSNGKDELLWPVANEYEISKPAEAYIFLINHNW